MSEVERCEIKSREQWLALRKGDVTASVVAALFGLHPYETIAGLHASKSGLELPGPDPESDVIRRGIVLEDIVAQEVARIRRTWRIERAGVYLRDPALRLGATPDFFIHDDARGLGVLQTKVVGARQFARQWETNPPPFWITLQTATEMMLADAAFGVVGALVISDFKFETHLFELPRHIAAEKRIRDATRKFWSELEAGVVPAIDYERDGELIKLLFPRERPGKVIDLTQDNRIGELLEQRENAHTQMKAVKKTIETTEAEIKVKLGDAAAAIVPGWHVSFKLQTRAAHQVRETSFRALRATREKGNDDD